MRPFDLAQVSILVALTAIGCGSSNDPQAQRDTGATAQAAAQIKSVAIHIAGFKRSKSGAI